MENITLIQSRDIITVKSLGGRQEKIPGTTKYTCTCTSNSALTVPDTSRTWEAIQKGSSIYYQFNCKIFPLYVANKIIVYKCIKFIMHNRGVVTSEDTLQKLLSISDIELEDALALTKLQTQPEV